MKSKDVFLYFAFFLIAALCIYLFFYIRSNSYQCMNNPLVYGVQHLEYSSGMPITCTCSVTNGDDYLVVTNESISNQGKLESFIKK